MHQVRMFKKIIIKLMDLYIFDQKKKWIYIYITLHGSGYTDSNLVWFGLYSKRA